MATINVRRDVADQFYRYQMPRLATKVEGKGNGIKTVVTNMHEIGKALNRPPSYPTKFFGCELGSLVTCDEKNNRYIVNGVHEASRLQDLLDVFINKFVLCGLCKNPETVLSVSRGSVVMKCRACGQKSLVDQNHRLVTFVLKTTKKTRDQPQVSAQSKDLSAGPREESTAGERPECQKLAEYILETGLADDGFVDKARELGIKNHRALFLCFRFGFTDKILEEMPRHLRAIQTLGVDRKCQRAVLNGIEKLLTKSYPALVKDLPLILHYLYTNNVLEEDVLLDWAAQPSESHLPTDRALSLRESASEFVEWLKQGPEEE